MHMIVKRMRYPGIFVTVLLAFFPGIIANSQTISVQLLNGQNGKPIKKGIRIWAYFNNDAGRHILDLHTDREGQVQFDVNGAKTFQVSPVGYVPCGEQPIGSSARDYAVAEVLRTGLLTANDCGRLSTEPIRGRLSYFVKPASWWELFKN